MEIKKRLSSIIESPSHNTTEKLEKICHLLDQEFDYFNLENDIYLGELTNNILKGKGIYLFSDNPVINFYLGARARTKIN